MAKHVYHAGIAGLLVNGVTGPNQIQCNDFLNSADNWVGQLIFVCSNVNGDVPLWNFKVTAFDAPTGTLMVTPDCEVLDGGGAVDPTKSVQAGDVLIVYSQATAATATTITNTMWDNSVNRQQFPGSAGMKPNDEVGRIVRILRNKGAGQWRYVTANDAFKHTVSPPWDVIPDTTSLYIVEAPDWLDPSESSHLVAPTAGISVEMHTEVPNLTDEVVLVGGFLMDTDGHQTDDGFACYRMIYVFGQPPTVRVVGPADSPYSVQVTDQVIRVDTTSTDVTLTLLPLTDYQGRGLLIFNEGPNSTIINTTAPDTFPDDSVKYTLSGDGATMRITAGGIYSA
jgi:hypothetical protein